jgi:hypothetical protein
MKILFRLTISVLALASLAACTPAATPVALPPPTLTAAAAQKSAKVEKSAPTAEPKSEKTATSTPRPAASSTPAPSSQSTPASGMIKGKPNIIFVLADDLDAAAIQYMPKLKSLITDQGETFPNYFVPESLCCPSRATTLRGQYPHNTKILSNDPPLGGFQRFFQLAVCRRGQFRNPFSCQPTGK